MSRQLSIQYLNDKLNLLDPYIYLLCPTFRFQVRNHLLQCHMRATRVVYLRDLRILYRIRILRCLTTTLRLPLRFSAIYKKAKNPLLDINNYPQSNFRMRTIIKGFKNIFFN